MKKGCESNLAAFFTSPVGIGTELLQTAGATLEATRATLEAACATLEAACATLEAACATLEATLLAGEPLGAAALRNSRLLGRGAILDQRFLLHFISP